MRSRNIGSPQWMSSKTTTSGRAAAASSNTLRTSQNSSSAVARACRDRLDRGVRSELLEHIDHRPERDPFAVVETAAANDGRVDAGQELRHETRLADAGRAEHGDEVAGTLAHAALEGLP